MEYFYGDSDGDESEKQETNSIIRRHKQTVKTENVEKRKNFGALSYM